MFVQPVDYLLALWFVIAALSTVYVAYDQFAGNPEAKWLVHCHIPHHTTNNNQEPNGGGGLMLLLDVSG